MKRTRNSGQPKSLALQLMQLPAEIVKFVLGLLNTDNYITYNGPRPRRRGIWSGTERMRRRNLRPLYIDPHMDRSPTLLGGFFVSDTSRLDMLRSNWHPTGRDLRGNILDGV